MWKVPGLKFINQNHPSRQRGYLTLLRVIEKILSFHTISQALFLGRRYWWLFIGLITVFVTVTFIRDVLSPSYYTAKTTLMALDSIPSPRSNTPSLAKGGESAQKLINILKSRELSKAVLQVANLNQELVDKNPKKSSHLDNLAESFRGQVQVYFNRQTNLIEISFTDHDRQRAALIPNLFAEELSRYVSSNSLTMSKKGRQSIEARLENNRREIMETENKILELYPMNPETLSNNIPVTATPAPLTPSTLNSRGTFSYLLLKRDMLKATYGTLVQQYELMKIEETKDEIAFQVIDPAIPPTVRISPQMRKDLTRSFFTAILCCIGIVYVSEHYFFSSKKGKEESKKEQEEENQSESSIRKLSKINY